MSRLVFVRGRFACCEAAESWNEVSPRWCGRNRGRGGARLPGFRSWKQLSPLLGGHKTFVNKEGVNHTGAAHSRTFGPAAAQDLPGPGVRPKGPSGGSSTPPVLRTAGARAQIRIRRPPARPRESGSALHSGFFLASRNEPSSAPPNFPTHRRHTLRTTRTFSGERNSEVSQKREESLC